MEFTRKNNNNRQLLSKIATNDRHGENTPYFDGWKAYDSNPFHPTQNPQGVIQMGLAENQLCFDLIEKWILENADASICTAEGVDRFSEIAIFQDYHGLKEFREGVAKFMGRVGGNRVKFDPNRIVMSGGATGANETVMFCLADPGDAFLVPSPYYAAFARDLRWRTGLEIVPVDCKSSNNFRITRAALEEAYEKAQSSNINVKGVIIANPSNPLGTVLDRETMRSLVSFINDKSIHLVCERIGISSLKSNAGLFFWMDMRPLLKEQTVQAELELWRVIINKVKLNVSPGSSFQCSEPGWFRVCFANMDDETVDVALERIREFVHQGKEENSISEKSKHWRKQNLRLSFSSSRLYNESLMSPHMISPHSPIPQSPLVRART